MKCGTSGILPVSRREQNEVDDFSKSTSRLKSTNRDSSNLQLILSLIPPLIQTIAQSNRRNLSSLIENYLGFKCMTLKPTCLVIQSKKP